MDKILALFIDAFKAKSPKVWAIIAFVLMTVQYGITQGNLFGVFPIEGVMKEVAYWLNWFITMMVGSRTTTFLNPNLSIDLPTTTPVEKNKGGRPRKYPLEVQ
jgi:hypothetical protein